ncbi:MAG: DUF1189 domain-containing protein, partial [Desulfobacterales bacterium]|nr:DUF1189 domain-containing protein [Desulfobacterales bacterium]
MNQYSIFHIPVFSFFSKSLYRDVCLRWKGTCFVYLLLLLSVCMIAPIIRMDGVLTKFVDNEAPKMVSQLPAFSIVDGKVSIDKSEPYNIKEPETGETLIVIDTTGTITSLAETQAKGLITETEV